jgi:acetyltransferase-like isoleucine patch superfamily enzyme
MLKILSYYIDLSLTSEGPLFLPKILLDRVAFHLFYKHYYKKRFKFYGHNIRWGKYFSRRTIPRSVRLANLHLISLGNDCQLEEGVYLQANQESEGIHLGDNVRINAHTHILAGGKISIGKKVLIAPFVLISSINHNNQEKYPIIDQQMKFSADIKIGEGSWIGQRAVLLGGTEIQSNSTVGAASVVNKSFKETGLLVGVPAQLVKQNG